MVMSLRSLLSLNLSNLFMEKFEDKVLVEDPHPAKFWGRYDDTGVITKKIHEDQLFQHISQQYHSTKFIIEKEGEDQSLPMLDLKLKREGNSITTDIYWKPTHTDQYLLWSSHHSLQQKLGTVRTLMHMGRHPHCRWETEEREECESSTDDLWVTGVGLERERTEREETVEKGARETERHRSDWKDEESIIFSSVIHGRHHRKGTESLQETRRCPVCQGRLHNQEAVVSPKDPLNVG